MSQPLDSRQLRAFRVLARTGSFTQTARELHLTQSGISHSMKALETEIGCRLLDRLGKKLSSRRRANNFCSTRKNFYRKWNPPVNH